MPASPYRTRAHGPRRAPAADRDEVHLVAVGGAALRLLGLIDRTTSDVDVIARLPDASASVSPPTRSPLPWSGPQRR